MRQAEAIRPGTDFYHRTFGGTNRWGDYSAVAVDPNDECFWVYNKHAVTRNGGGASENGLYETAFGEFCNQNPNAVNDSITVTEGGSASVLDGGSGTVLNNDTDPDSADSLLVALVSGPVDAAGFTLNANGTFNYNHNGDEAPTDSFTYNACDDGTPVKCTQATVNININAVDDSPTAVADTDTVDENSSNNVITVLDNDTDPDGGPLQVTNVAQPANGSTTFTASNVSYTPDPDYCNDGLTTDDFTYTINGGSIATVQVSVTCQVNLDPIAVNDNATTDEDTLVSVAVLNNDNDPDVGDTLSVTSCSGASNGSVVLNGNNCDFTPSANFNGMAGFSYAISDGNGGSDSATVSVTVNAVNDEPVAVNDNATTDEDTLVSVAVLVNDSDVDTGDTLSVTSCSGASNGSVVLNGNNCDFTPSANFNGVAGFNYAISDGNGGTDIASVTLTVNAVNDEPSMAVNQAVYVSLSEIASPPAQNMACQFDFGPNEEDQSQAVNDMIVQVQSDPDNVLNFIDIDNAGAVSYTFSGNSGVAEVTVMLQDDGGTAFSGDDTSVPYTFNVHVQDYIFRNNFESNVCQ